MKRGEFRGIRLAADLIVKKNYWKVKKYSSGRHVGQTLGGRPPDIQQPQTLR